MKHVHLRMVIIKSLIRLLKNLKKHVNLHKSVTVNWYLFFRERQKDGQSLENYIKQLATMCNSCNFDKDNTMKDNLLRDMIISGIIDKRLQEKLLRLEDNKATLTNVINICRTHEVSIENGQKLENECQATEAVNKIGVQQHNTYGMARVNQNRRNGNMAMYGKNNGNDMVYDSEQRNRIKPLYQHNANNCYFCGKKCNYCMRLNHFESVCQQKLKSDRPIQQIMQADEREQSESVNTVTSQICNEWFVSKVSDSNLFTDTNTWNTTVKVEDVEIPVKVASGADVSIINIEEFKWLKNPPNLIKMQDKIQGIQSN